MPYSTNVPAESIDLARVGDGFIESRRGRFSSVYRITGGINPLIEDRGSTNVKLGSFENAIRQLRPNEEIQVILRRVPADPTGLISHFKETIKESAPDGYQHHFAPYYEGWISDFLLNNRLCGYEVFLLFSIDFNLLPLSEMAVGFLSNVFGKKKNKVEDSETRSAHLEEVKRRAKTWTHILGVTGVVATELKEDEIYRLLYSEINLMDFKGETRGFRKAAPVSAGPGGLETLREAISAQPVLSDPAFVKVGEKYVRTMSVTNFPEVGRPDHFLSEFLYQKEDFKVTFFIRGMDQELGKSLIRSQLRIDQATGDDGTTPNYDAAANWRKRDSVLAAIAQKETGLGQVSLFISVYGNSEKELKNNYENFTSRFEGIHRYDGYYQQEELFYSTLPLMSNQVRDRVERLQMTVDLCNLWPFFFDSLTVEKGVILGHTASNEPLSLNLWNPQAENYNIGVFGQPGTGKSFIIQTILDRLMPSDPKVMLIDRSGAYKTSCLVAGGEYIYFDLKCEKHINAFDCPEESYQKKGIVSEDQEETILGFLTTLLTETGESSLSNVANSVLLEAIKKTYKAKFDREKKEGVELPPPLLRDLRKQLIAMAKDADRSAQGAELCSTYAEVLTQYTEDGTFANITDRETNIDRKTRFIVFDTSLAAKREKVKAMVTYIVSTYCFAQARKAQQEGEYPIIGIDEFWDLLSFSAGQDFADILSRTSRHLSLVNIFATQKIADCMASEKAKTALDNAATKIFMKLGDADRALCVGAFELGEKESAIIGGLHQVRNVYSQCFIHSSARQGLAYVCPDPVIRWIATSYPVDKNRRAKYMEYYNPDENQEGAWEAILRLTQDEFTGNDPDFLRS